MVDPTPKRRKVTIAATQWATEVDATLAAKLEISQKMMPRPEMPDEFAIKAGLAESVPEYMSKLASSVVWRLSVYLHGDSDVALAQPLRCVVCPGFSNEKLEKPVTNLIKNTGISNYKAPWNMASALESLKANGLYEAALPLWGFNPTLKEATCGQSKVNLLGVEPQWTQLDACRSLWSE